MTVYSCPLCDWTMADEPEPDTLSSVATPLAIESALGVPPGYMAGVLAQDHRQKVEAALQEHLSGHTLPEWVGKVTELQRRINELESLHRPEA